MKFVSLYFITPGSEGLTHDRVAPIGPTEMSIEDCINMLDNISMKWSGYAKKSIISNYSSPDGVTSFIMNGALLGIQYDIFVGYTSY